MGTFSQKLYLHSLTVFKNICSKCEWLFCYLQRQVNTAHTMEYSPFADITIETRFPKKHVLDIQTHSMLGTVLVYMENLCPYLTVGHIAFTIFIYKQGPQTLTALLWSPGQQTNDTHIHRSDPDISEWTWCCWVCMFSVVTLQITCSERKLGYAEQSRMKEKRLHPLTMSTVTSSVYLSFVSIVGLKMNWQTLPS